MNEGDQWTSSKNECKLIINLLLYKIKTITNIVHKKIKNYYVEILN